MIIEDVANLPVNTKVLIACDKCSKKSMRRISSIKTQRAKHGEDKDYCRSCASQICCSKKPQCSKDFWLTKERKEKHGISIKNSVLYKEGIKNRQSIVGENNPTWGLKHKQETKTKMSISRTGKTGENATAWKGGRMSIVRRIKSALQRKYKWFHRVMDRDNCICQKCTASKNLDAHHIVPIANIVKKLLSNKEFLTEAEKMDWLIVQPEIVDDKLTNGITLCRKCHKEIHQNWGSHEPKVR